MTGGMAMEMRLERSQLLPSFQNLPAIKVRPEHFCPAVKVAIEANRRLGGRIRILFEGQEIS